MNRVFHNVPADNAGAPPAAPVVPVQPTAPIPPTAPQAPRNLTPAELVAVADLQSGMQYPNFPLIDQPSPTGSTPAGVPAEPSAAAPTTPPVQPALSPMQAALQLLNSGNPESIKAGKQLLDSLLAPPQSAPAQPTGPEIPPAPNWDENRSKMRAEVETYFKDLYKQPVVEDGKQVLNDKGEPEFIYPDLRRLQWQIETELDRRIDKERSSYENKVSTIQQQFAQEQQKKSLERQWNDMFGTTVQNTLLQQIYENVPDARVKGPDGKEGIKRSVFQNFEKLGKALAREISEELNYDDPRYAGPAGLHNVMNDIGTKLQAELGKYLPKGTGAAPTTPTAPVNTAPPPSVGAPLGPTAYTPPVPGTGKPTWDKPMSVRDRAAIGLTERLAEAVGGQLPRNPLS
ncbi:MAG: hypothetical protein E6R03_09545 [Hyphomicrobiaceae bacterium]|nr:MAG: hypothetical protein E6R03_09545 [Hyphomicrobiaceae bacterium]